MSSRVRGRVAWSATAGFLLAIVLAQPAAALSFGSARTISTDGTVSAPGALAITGTSSAVVAFELMAPGDDYSARAVYIRRTGDGGTTWTNCVRLSTYGDDIAEWGTGYASPWYTAGRPALAAYGAKVSLVFAEQYDLTPYYGVRYLGSNDGGKDWFEAGELMIDDARPVTPAVARTSTQVAVAWTDGDTGSVRVAVSSDGGDIFRDPVTVGGTTSTPWSDRWDPTGIGTYTFDGEPALAFGSSGLYVTWNVGNRIVVRRSTDGGRTWKPTVNLAWTPSTAGPTVAASGASIVVAYVTDTGAVVSRRSTDYGSTWRSAETLSSTTLDTDLPCSAGTGRHGCWPTNGVSQARAGRPRCTSERARMPDRRGRPRPASARRTAARMTRLGSDWRQARFWSPTPGTTTPSPRCTSAAPTRPTPEASRFQASRAGVDSDAVMRTRPDRRETAGDAEARPWVRHTARLHDGDVDTDIAPDVAASATGPVTAVAAAAGVALPAGAVLRPLRQPDDYAEMNRIANALRAAIGDSFTTSVAQMAAYYDSPGRFVSKRDVIVVETDGRIVGYGRTGLNEEVAGLHVYEVIPFLDPALDPEPLYPLLLSILEAHARALAAADPAPEKMLETFGGDAAPILEGHVLAAGFVPARHSYAMVRPHLDDLPDAPLPDGLEIRPVLPEHRRRIWDAGEEAYRDAWGATESTAADYERWLTDRNQSDTALWQIAWDGDEVAGQVRAYIDDEENARFGRLRGYTEHILVGKRWRRRGLARALIAASFPALRARGMQEAALGVDTENVSGALRLYERCGFRPISRQTTFRKPLG